MVAGDRFDTLLSLVAWPATLYFLWLILIISVTQVNMETVRWNETPLNTDYDYEWSSLKLGRKWRANRYI